MNFKLYYNVLIIYTKAHLDFNINHKFFLKQINGRPLSKVKGGSVLECDDCGNFANCYNITSTGKIKALLQKNFLRMWRNVGYVFSRETVYRIINNQVFYLLISVLSFLRFSVVIFL